MRYEMRLLKNSWAVCGGEHSGGCERSKIGQDDRPRPRAEEAAGRAFYAGQPDGACVKHWQAKAFREIAGSVSRSREIVTKALIREFFLD